MNWESLLWVVVATLNGVWGAYKGVNWMRSEAIKYGVAKWAINPETGKRTFQWLGPLNTDEKP